MKLRRIISSILVVFCLGCVVGCDKDVTIQPYEYPTSNKSFSFYAYNAVRKNTYFDDMDHNIGESFVTLEKLQEYKDCGFDIMMCPSSYSPGGADHTWETILDLAEQVGLKVLIADTRISAIADSSVSQIGEGATFANEDEMDAQIAVYMSDYIDHPAFYGIVMKDEPSAAILQSGAYGQVYRSIKRVCPEAYMHVNTCSIGTYSTYRNHPSKFPELERDEYLAFVGGNLKDGGGSTLTAEEIEALSDDEFYTLFEDNVATLDSTVRRNTQFDIMEARYGKMLSMIIETTGTDHLAIDAYPMYDNPMTSYIRNLQVAADVTKEHGVDFHMVSQTMTLRPNGSDNDRILTDDDLRWLNNMILGFGVKTICYFTYFTHDGNNNEQFIDGGSFITNFGEKTDIYYSMQQIFKENQAFAPTILNFDYVGSATYSISPSYYAAEYCNVAKQNTFSKLSGVELDKEHALVTELYDKTNEKYMYMVQNVVDSKFQGSKSYQTVTLTFAKEYKYALVYRNGKSTAVALNNHKLTVENRAGDAAYVLPY